MTTRASWDLLEEPTQETPAPRLGEGRGFRDDVNDLLGFRGALVQLRVELGIGRYGHIGLFRLGFELVNDLFEQGRDRLHRVLQARDVMEEELKGHGFEAVRPLGYFGHA